MNDTTHGSNAFHYGDLYGNFLKREFQGKIFQFVETKTAPALMEEIFNDSYSIFKSGMEFKPGDVVVDLGANEGLFSILLAKLYPEIRVISVEPVIRTLETLRQNITVNGCENITVCDKAIHSPRGDRVSLTISKDYSGGSTSFCTFIPEDHYQQWAETITLNKLYEQYGVKHCKLLKVDIEGMEYEALYYGIDALDNTDSVVIEVHINNNLEFMGRRPDGLVNWLTGHTKVVHASLCRMAD